ncbi:MAG: Gfo/Idh/MocA family oxidoreductase [Bryobacterales bacterium]
MERRRFLAASAATALSAQRILGANDRIGVGTIGTGGRGRLLTSEIKENPKAEMRAVCDVYKPNLELGREAAGGSVPMYEDYERLLENKDVDAVVVATPDHWHARMTIDAVEAGKDVYVEKPMCHEIDEGFDVIEAVRRTKRIVQVGTQRRSYDIFLEGKKVMESGAVGTVRLVNAWWYNHASSTRAATLDGDLNWEKWLGSAPKRPLDAMRFRNWYYFYDYSGGLMIGQAAHVVDCIHWYMDSGFPEAVTCAGGKIHLDGVEIPETTTMILEYPEDFVHTFTVGYKAMRYNQARDQLYQFNGDKARFDVSREWHALYPQDTAATDPKPTLERKQYGSWPRAAQQHIDNFLDCIVSRKEPNAPVEQGQTTNVALVMALESLKTGRRVRWNAAARKMES